MKSDVYAIYDEASQAFIQFTACINEAVAKMTFTKMFKEKRLNVSMIYDYPNNFKVYKLGTFDDNKGLFDNLPQHEFLLDFSTLIPTPDCASLKVSS